jgi:hypothetical protein
LPANIFAFFRNIGAQASFFLNLAFKILALRLCF